MFTDGVVCFSDHVGIIKPVDERNVVAPKLHNDAHVPTSVVIKPFTHKSTHVEPDNEYPHALSALYVLYPLPQPPAFKALNVVSPLFKS